jgi:hypothetical protein
MGESSNLIFGGRMKRALVLLIALMVLTSGCLGGGEKEKPASPTQTLQSNSPLKPETTTSTLEKKPFNPLKALEEIHEYTYREKASVNINFTMVFSNGTQRSGLTIRINESGYLDLKGRVAQINTTTTTLPDNVTATLVRTIVNGTEYISLPGGGLRRLNDTGVVWGTNPVTLAETIVKTQRPIANYTENGTLVLVYSPSPELMLPLAELYFSGPKTNVTVLDSTISLIFKNSKLVGMRLSYSILATGKVTDPLLGEIKIEQRGEWKGEVEITSINRKFEVKPPT